MSILISENHKSTDFGSTNIVAYESQKSLYILNHMINLSEPTFPPKISNHDYEYGDHNAPDGGV
ncbi:hypothetical protein KJ652_03230, partial [Patescibacteria group bacterium]|nr:hypothetical protein [Patescibacteria group bacterium]